jgi:hypothetical protein
VLNAPPCALLGSLPCISPSPPYRLEHRPRAMFREPPRAYAMLTRRSPRLDRTVHLNPGLVADRIPSARFPVLPAHTRLHRRGHMDGIDANPIVNAAEVVPVVRDSTFGIV